jgi:hypothetical protein
MDEAQVSALLSKTRAAAMTGKYEPFKTTAVFDSTLYRYLATDAPRLHARTKGELPTLFTPE